MIWPGIKLLFWLIIFLATMSRNVIFDMSPFGILLRCLYAFYDHIYVAVCVWSGACTSPAIHICNTYICIFILSLSLSLSVCAASVQMVAPTMCGTAGTLPYFAPELVNKEPYAYEIDMWYVAVNMGVRVCVWTVPTS
jgi:serine/threonine protein kinase